MRPGPTLRNWLTAAGIGLLAASFPSCGSSSPNGVAGDDAGADAQAGDSTIQADDAPNCDPCEERCSCGPSETLNGSCVTLTCPPSRTWGGKNFCNSGCEDAGDDSSNCDPCVSECPCDTGFPPRDDPSTCMLVICKGPSSSPTGTWGPGVFCPIVRACDGGLDAASEAGVDATPDAISEAASD